MTALRLPQLELHLTARDVQILETLEQYRLLTTRQIQRRHLPAAPFGSHATVSAATRGTTRILTRLEAVGAVARLDRRIGGLKHGSAITVWHLGAAGERHLRARRGDPVRKRYNQPGRAFIAHTLAIADVAIGLHELAGIGRFDLLELELEPTCWRSFTHGSAAPITLKPDLLAVTADAHTETHSFIEVDLGTEHMPAVLRKCQTYQRYHATGTEQHQRGLFPAVVWIVPDPLRAGQIRDAIATDKHLDPALFWITTPDTMSSQLAPYPATVTT